MVRLLLEAASTAGSYSCNCSPPGSCSLSSQSRQKWNSIRSQIKTLAGTTTRRFGAGNGKALVYERCPSFCRFQRRSFPRCSPTDCLTALRSGLSASYCCPSTNSPNTHHDHRRRCSLHLLHHRTVRLPSKIPARSLHRSCQLHLAPEILSSASLKSRTVADLPLICRVASRRKAQPPLTKTSYRLFPVAHLISHSHFEVSHS